MPDPRILVDAALPFVKSLSDCADYTKTVQPFLPQLYDLPYRVAAHITDLQGLEEIYLATNPLITSLAIALFLTPVVLIVSEINKNYSQVDRLWSIIPAFYNVHYALWAHLNGLPTFRLDHVMAVSVIWSARLTFNYWRKGGYTVGSEDYRWAIVKDYIGPAGMFLLNVTFISLGQNVSSSLKQRRLHRLTKPQILLWLISTPTYILLLSSRVSGNELSTYDTFFSRMMLVIVVVEFFADQQQWNYHQAKDAYSKTAKVPSEHKYTREQLDRGFNTSGLWSISRHPNFLAEQSFWVVLYQWACMESWSYFNWTFAGAFGYLVLFQSSTWLTELLSAGKYPEYKVYQERVGKFLPKPNTKNMSVPHNAKEKQKVQDAKAGKGSLKR
jgi:steroid 5-alpha reductase family enzyme